METFARLYKMPQRLWLLSIIALMATIAVPVMAQDYTPPPMFDIPDPLPPANGQKPLPSAKTQPRKSSPAVQETVKRPAVAKKSGMQAEDIPVPEAKPARGEIVQPVKKTAQQTEKKEYMDVPVPSKKPSVPQKYTKAQPAPEPITEQPKPRPGVVTGPKTMPAVPAQDFEAETLYQDEDGQIQGAILKRHAEAQEPKEPEEAQEPPQTEVYAQTLGQLNVFTSDDGQAQKVTIPLVQGQSELTTKMLMALQVKSREIFANNPTWRLQILSYATAFDQGQSSDRRMSLNRALSVRDALLQQDIEARKIDVRALGDKTKTEPKDRIDLIFYAPNTSPDNVIQ